MGASGRPGRAAPGGPTDGSRRTRGPSDGPARQNGGVTTAGARRRGPRPGAAADTRESIAAAARAEFAERGFGGATIRSIAARAEVDPALVHHYFGSKMDLFREVLSLDVDPARTVLPAFLDGPREEAGERIARAFLTTYEDPEFREPVLALMRSAMTDPQLAKMAGSLLQDALLPAVTSLGLGPEPERHVALAMTHLMGTVLGRHLVGLAALQGPVEDLVVELAPVVQRYLDGTNRG